MGGWVATRQHRALHLAKKRETAQLTVWLIFSSSSLGWWRWRCWQDCVWAQSYSCWPCVVPVVWSRLSSYGDRAACHVLQRHRGRGGRSRSAKCCFCVFALCAHSLVLLLVIRCCSLVRLGVLVRGVACRKVCSLCLVLSPSWAGECYRRFLYFQHRDIFSLIDFVINRIISPLESVWILP